jgi:Gamma-glutamyltranspeptidase
MLKNPDWSAIFAPNGKFLKVGETIRRTNLSRTLSTIAREGADAFYKAFIFLTFSMTFKILLTFSRVQLRTPLYAKSILQMEFYPMQI